MEAAILSNGLHQGLMIKVSPAHISKGHPASMADALPDWATTPRSKGWYVQTTADSAEDIKHAADDKGGLLIGRNGQVNARPDCDSGSGIS